MPDPRAALGPRPRTDRSGPAPRRRARRAAAAGLGLVLAGTLTACAGDNGTAADGSQIITWYINPDAGGQAEIAQRCSEASDGAYTISTQLLPRDAPGQREQLVRRLAANDASIDLMSIDPPYIAEFAAANFLAPVPDAVEQVVTQDVLDGALEGASFDGELVTVPFWANTQILWYRQSVAEAAGLDMTQPVTWDQIVEAAQSQDVTVAVQGTAAESLTVWVNSLVASAGGEILENPEAPADEIVPGIDSEAGRRAAEVVQTLAASGVGGAQLATSTEDTAATLFEGDSAGFMVNYPFVWARANSAVEAGTLDQATVDDYGWALYPQVDAGTPSAAPYGGINLGVGAFSENVDLAYEAAQCIVTPENQSYYFATNGNPPSSAAAYEAPEVAEAFPMAATIRESIDSAAPRPQTRTYDVVSTSIQRTWNPPGGVSPDTTPAESAGLMTDVLSGEALL